jgi:histidinol-phosphate/aromatic aminotransferase/cobyric acid decarboxylase-like protein
MLREFVDFMATLRYEPCSLRISVGTDEEMDRLIAFLKEYLEKRV